MKRSKALIKRPKTLIKRSGTARNSQERPGTVRNGEQSGTPRNVRVRTQ
jgi:hypothetical protein